MRLRALNVNQSQEYRGLAPALKLASANSMKPWVHNAIVSAVAIFVLWLGWYAIEHHDDFLLTICVIVAAVAVGALVAHVRKHGRLAAGHYPTWQR
jgi:uncharacterized membrane protein YqgA involved in biofilm formation